VNAKSKKIAYYMSICFFAEISEYRWILLVADVLSEKGCINTYWAIQYGHQKTDYFTGKISFNPNEDGRGRICPRHV